MNDQEFIDKFKSKILDVLKYSISFFEKHGLRWFIACGSAIGAIRHKGFIPWDDDVDIYMPRDDYNKLIALREVMKKDGYRFIDWDVKNYPLPFGKISDMNTTLWSKKRFPVDFGVYIDVFPLDLADYGMMPFGQKWLPYRMLLLQYRAKLSKISIGDLLQDLGHHKTDSIRVMMAKLSLLFVSRQTLLKKIKESERKWYREDGDRYVSYTEAGMYMFPREWFDEYVVVKFEDISVRISKFYDDYLTYIYADYMTPPPDDSRLPEGPHGKYFINLDKSIPLSRIKKDRSLVG